MAPTIQGKVTAARRSLRDAAKIATDHHFGEEEQELLRHSLMEVGQVVDLLERRIAEETA